MTAPSSACEDGHDWPRAFTVIAPATTANVGTGFDALGVALDIANVTRFTPIDPDTPIQIQHNESTPRELCDPERNVIAQYLASRADCRTGWNIASTNMIPMGAGLGSSAAAVATACVAGRYLLTSGGRWKATAVDEQWAIEAEGHPDNVVPALRGGASLTLPPMQRAPHTLAGARTVAHVPLHAGIQLILGIAKARCSTREARSHLPQQVDHATATRQAARAAGLMLALTGAPEMLYEATCDELHESFRAQLMPHTLAAVDQLRAAGHAAVVSGAGPSFACWHTGELSPRLVHELLCERVPADAFTIRSVAVAHHGAALRPA